MSSHRDHAPEKGAANGLATLDGTTKVPYAQLPAATTTTIGAVELATDGESAANVVVQGNDQRLSNDRTASGLRTATTVVSISGAAAPTIGQTLVATSSTAATWQTPPSSGETNTASNVNTGGVGVFKQKTGVNLEFRGINAASSKVSVALDAPNNEIDVDLGSVALDDLSDVATSGQARGHGLAYNGSGWVPVYIPLTLECGRNANATNIWLRGGDGVPHNLSPLRMPWDAKIVAVSATTNGSETWDVEIYKNSDVRIAGTPTEGNAIIDFAISASQSASNTYSVDVASGDEIGVFCRGSTIDNPHVLVFMVRRA